MVLSEHVAAAAGPFDGELAFTEAYRRHQDRHIAVREAMCLRAMYPWRLLPIRDEDLFAGRQRCGLVGFALELGGVGEDYRLDVPEMRAGGGRIYYCHEDEIREKLARADVDDEYRRRVEAMLDFWRDETTEARADRRLPDDALKAVRNRIARGNVRLAGVLPDFARLVRLGLPGLRRQVRAARAEREGPDAAFFDGMLMALDVLADVCRHYAREARQTAGRAGDGGRAAELHTMADVLDHLPSRAPQSLREAIQLHWLYSLVSGALNYGRMDVALGGHYVRDVDSGVLTDEEALRLLQSFWRLIADRNSLYNSRVILGGMGRPDESAADRFALRAMEATRTVPETEPQLSLRFYRGMDPALMAKALDMLGKGRTYPILYNDDINVPAVQACFSVPRDAAEQYVPYGCGEYGLEHLSFGSPNCGFNLLKALEATLHNGRDALNGEPLGLALGEFEGFETFEQLFHAYGRQVEYHAEMLGRRHAAEYATERESACFLLISMLYDDCLARGRSIVDGGARYQGAIFESFGMVNAADSLTAIKKLVYDTRALSKGRLLAALEADFEGFERERLMLLDAPKYGNDDPEADEMMRRVSEHACKAFSTQAPGLGLHYCAIVNINNSSNVNMGRETAASAEGRRAGRPLANGNNPTAGRDTAGITAFLNSIVRPDPTLHAGYVQNMKFSRRLFQEDRARAEALLETYFARGGTQAMITVVSRGDLARAMAAPEDYRDLMVRVGGFSARFVELSRDVQVDVLNRTLH